MLMLISKTFKSYSSYYDSQIYINKCNCMQQLIEHVFIAEFSVAVVLCVGGKDVLPLVNMRLQYSHIQGHAVRLSEHALFCLRAS